MSYLDYFVLVMYLGAVLSLGWYFRNRHHGGNEYFIAGRSMGWIPLGLSIMVTIFSAINYLAFPNEVFGYGLYVIVALPVFFLAAWPVNRIWMPFFHSMKLTSAYEYLERRFDVRVRCLASGMFILWRLFWMATALYASGQIMSILTGFHPGTIILIGGIAAILYTSLGGMRAVIWTDVLQFAVLFGGILLGVIFAMGDGGLRDLLEIAYHGGRLKPFAPFDPRFLSFDPRIRMTLWSGLLGVFVAFLSRYGSDQVVMQRYFSARSLSAARKSLWLNACVSVLSFSLLVLMGLAIYANAVKHGVMQTIDWEALPPLQRKGLAMKQLAMLIHGFPSGVTGLVIAGLLAATMSSLDSGLNACSAALMTDFYKRFPRRKSCSKENELTVGRMLTGGFGVAAIVMGLALIPLTGQTQSLFMIVNKMVNGIGSPLLTLIVLGMFTRSANAPGVFYGGLIGLTASLIISLTVKPLALQYYSVINLLVSIGACMVCSLIAKNVWGINSDPDKLRWTWLIWNQTKL